MSNYSRTLPIVVIFGLMCGVVGSAQSKPDQEKPAKTSATQPPDKARQQQEEVRRERERTLARDKAMYPLTPLSVQVVVSRYQGDKKVSSLPYTLSVNANSMRWGGRVSQLRMGSQIPVTTIAQPKTADGKPPVPLGAVPFTYKDIGTSIDCTAVSAEDGRYQVNLSIDESSVYSGDSVAGETPRANDLPIFRSFRSTNELLLKDGQSAQFTAATDRVSGEVVRIDVTLTVRK